MEFSYEELSKMIDHALLSPFLTEVQLDAGIELAKAYNVASICILPYYVRHCTERLADSTVLPSTTIGFPHGGHCTKVKTAEAEQAIADGCQELDMVVNISQVLSGKWEYVREDIRSVIHVAHDQDRKVKVIFENCYLNDDQKVRLCQICNELGADWIKTSTGFGTEGATMEDLKLMVEHAAEGVQVKAAGGVRDMDALIEVRKLGVTRCGASRTREILDPAREKLGLPPINLDPGVNQSHGY